MLQWIPIVQNSDQKDKRKQTKMMICHQKKWECEIGGGRKQRQKKKNTERQKLPSLQNNEKYNTSGRWAYTQTVQSNRRLCDLYNPRSDIRSNQNFHITSTY